MVAVIRSAARVAGRRTFATSSSSSNAAQQAKQAAESAGQQAKQTTQNATQQAKQTAEKASGALNEYAKKAQELGGPALKRVEGLLGGKLSQSTLISTSTSDLCCMIIPALQATLSRSSTTCQPPDRSPSRFTLQRVSHRLPRSTLLRRHIVRFGPTPPTSHTGHRSCPRVTGESSASTLSRRTASSPLAK